MNPKKTALTILRVLVLVPIFFFSFALGISLAGMEAAVAKASEAARAGEAVEGGKAALALLVVCFLAAPVIAYPILRSRWSGLKLIGTISLVFFGVMYFLSQVESYYFRGPLGMSTAEIERFVLGGAITTVIFSVLAVMILGKMRPSEITEPPPPRLKNLARELAWKVPVLALVYIAVYYLFGYFVAWQSPAVRQLYSGSTEISPFFSHLTSHIASSPFFFPFQFLRGLVWVALALPIVRMMRGKDWETPLAVGLLFALPGFFLLIPNPYMPEAVRLAHLLEGTTSNFLFGGLVGWLLARTKVPPQMQVS